MLSWPTRYAPVQSEETNVGSVLSFVKSGKCIINIGCIFTEIKNDVWFLHNGLLLTAL